MTDVSSEPNTEQLTIWRNLLDAFGQLSSAWDTAEQAQQQLADATVPEELVAAFAYAAARGAEALSGAADVLAAQNAEAFDAVAEAQRAAGKAWQDARQATGQ